jgi:hypothetical protein
MVVKTCLTKTTLTFLGSILLLSCVKDPNFNPPKVACAVDLVANTSFAAIKNLHSEGVVEIHDDLILEGYVISSDREGNFFGSLHFQDNPRNPTEGFQIDIDLRDSHLLYPVGSKFFIKLKGLYLGKRKGVYKLGGVFTSFGNLSIGRLPANVVSQHIINSCDSDVSLVPVQINLGMLDDTMVNTLVELNDVEILEDEINFPFAEFQEETERNLVDCDDHEIRLLNSGYADFQAEILPSGRGSLIGILLKDNNGFQIVIRSLGDINFEQIRCEDLIDEFTSTSIFISELADPDNNLSARFVELYNAGSESLSLKGWTLNRFTNGNTEIGSSIDFSGFVIDAETTLVISPNATEFEAVYGFLPNLGVGTNSPADSNGDDNLQLIDPFGMVVDAFGIVGEDGTGTNHEFEDGRAIRNPDVFQANSTYTFTEWIIYNDTGASGTINQPQKAPENFTPGVRN